jgi:outer membrane protein
MMKNLSLILNAVLFTAVVVLYILFFLTRQTDHTTEHKLSEISKYDTMVQSGIVFIDIDSVLQKYDMYFDLSADLQDKLKTSEAQLASKEQSLRKEMEDFQYKIDRGLVTRAEAADIQQQLAQKEQSLYQLQNSLQMQLSEEEQVAQHKVLNSIMEYLKSLEESGTYKYQYVLGATFGGNILYANESMNITHAVIEGLNSEYAKAQKKGEK